jgi:hypothetical protein
VDGRPLRIGERHPRLGDARGEAELIRTAVRHELLGAPAGQAERAERRARLLDAIGALDRSVYPAGYLDELRACTRGNRWTHPS